MNNILEKIRRILQNFPVFSHYLIEQFLINKSKLQDFLFTSDENSNIAFKDLILMSINLSIEANPEQIFKEIQNIVPNQEIKPENNNQIVESQSQSPVIQLLEHFVSWFPKEASKNWTKFSAFLEVRFLIKI